MLKTAVFWDVTPCRYFVNRRFGGTYRLHLQGIRNTRAMNQREQVAVDWATCSRCFIARVFLIPWRWRRYVPPKRRLTKYLHGAKSQKTAFFMVIAMKTSNLTSDMFANIRLLVTFGGTEFYENQLFCEVKIRRWTRHLQDELLVS
jgi:hypothetical protein